MDLILEGNLNASNGTREVLQTLLVRQPEATGILRFSSPRRNINGRLALLSGKFIVGAQITDTDESGYSALKSLLSISDGNFAFLATSNKEALDLGTRLHIDLNALISRLPNLPESSAELFDEKSLLDQVFGEGNLASLSLQDNPEADTAILPAEPELLDKIPQSGQAWHAVSSLMQRDSGGEQASGPILGAESRTPARQIEVGYSTLERLKAVQLGKMPVFVPVLWALGILVLALVLWLAYPIFFH